jgi:hypothetical protein
VFAPTYYAPTYFPPRYYPPGADVVLVAATLTPILADVDGGLLGIAADIGPLAGTDPLAPVATATDDAPTSSASDTHATSSSRSKAPRMTISSNHPET